MKSFLANYRITKVVFYHAEFGELANWLLLKFAKKGVSIEYHKVLIVYLYQKQNGIKV